MFQQPESHDSNARAFFSIRFLRLRVLSLGLFVLSSLSQPLPALAQANSPLIGDWLGSLSTPVGDLRILFHVRANADSLQLTLDSPDQNATGIPAEVTSAAADAVRFDVTVASGYFEGVLASDGSTLTGTWSQGGANLPLTLKRQEGMAEIAAIGESMLEAALVNQLQGTWSGTVNAMGTAIPMTLAVDRLSATEVRGRFGVSTQGISDLPFTIAAEADDITFTVAPIGASFRGRLNDEGNELVGNFNQFGQQFQLNLKLTR